MKMLKAYKISKIKNIYRKNEQGEKYNENA